MKVSKRKPKPTQKILDMEAELLTKARQERMEEVLREKVKLEIFDNLDFDQVKRISKTEDQVKDDLIKEKLISNKLMKMKSKMSKIAKIRMKKEKGLNATCTDLKGELSVMLSNISSENEKVAPPVIEVKPDMTELEDFIAKKEDLIARKIKKKKEAWQVSDSKAEVRNGAAKAELNKKDTAITGEKDIASKEKKVETKDNIVKPSQQNSTVRAKRIISNAKKIKQKNSIIRSKFRPVTREKSVLNGKLRAPDKRRKNSRTREAAPVKEEKNENVKVEEDEVLDEEAVEEEEDQDSPPLLSRSMSGRKKRARKIFDPADHEMPTRPVKKSRLSGEDEIKEEIKEVKDIKESKDLKELKGAKEIKEVKQSKESKDVKQSKETKDMKPSKEIKEMKEIKEVRDTRQSKDSKETRLSRENKENKEVKEPNVFKTPEPSPSETRGSRQGSRRKVKTLVEPTTDQVRGRNVNNLKSLTPDTDILTPGAVPVLRWRPPQERATDLMCRL